jgi:hypothetical protein
MGLFRLPKPPIISLQNMRAPKMRTMVRDIR